MLRLLELYTIFKFFSFLLSTKESVESAQNESYRYKDGGIFLQPWAKASFCNSGPLDIWGRIDPFFVSTFPCIV